MIGPTTRRLDENAINIAIVKDVRFINRRLLFRVKPALGLVPLGFQLSLPLSLLSWLLRLHKRRLYEG